MSRKTTRNVGHVKKAAAYHIGDATVQLDRVSAVHQYAEFQLKALAQAASDQAKAEGKTVSTPATMPIWDLSKALACCKKAISKFYNDLTVSKYLPHQGKQEVARRLARMQPVMA